MVKGRRPSFSDWLALELPHDYEGRTWEERARAPSGDGGRCTDLTPVKSEVSLRPRLHGGL